MGPLFYLFLLLTGAAGGFLSGLLGIGGGIVMMPLLLYTPPLIGIGAFSVKQVTGLTMAQGFFASLSALLFYGRQGFVSRPLVLTMGVSLFASSLAGSLFSRSASDGALLFIFGVLAALAAVLMLIPRDYKGDEVTGGGVSFNRALAAGIGLFTGFFLGMVGQAGAFITIPTMLYALKIPLRVALGSTLAIGLFPATAGLAGKAATGQIPFVPALVLVLAAIPAARLGAAVGKRSNTKILRWALAALIMMTAVKVWADIFLFRRAL
jgi:uncharacterized membrane protein YfcA